MRLSPQDKAFNTGIKQIVLEPSGERTVWIGYDNRDHLLVHGPLMNAMDRVVARAFRDRMCWKAVMYIGPEEENESKATVLHLGADVVYGLKARPRLGKALWVKPDEFITVKLRQLREW